MKNFINVLAGAALVFTSTLPLSLPANAAGFNGHARVTIEGGLKISAGIKLPKPFGGRKFTVILKGTKASFSSPATCLFPFDLKFEAKASDFNLGAIEAVFKNAKSFVPDGSTLAKCAGQIFYAMADGVVYAFSETAEIASLVVTDPVAAAKKIGAGIKMVNGKISEAPGEAAEAALKIGGKLGKLGANVGGEVVGQLSNIGGGVLKAGSSVGGAMGKFGGSVGRAAKKVGCKLGFGGCKKKRPPPPGIALGWAKMRGSGWEVAGSGVTKEKMWVLGGPESNKILYVVESGWKRFLHTPAVTRSGKTVSNFKTIAVGMKDALFAIGPDNTLYLSDGKFPGNKVTLQKIDNRKYVAVAAGGKAVWALSTMKTDGGYKVYRSSFDGTLRSINLKEIKGVGATALEVDRAGKGWIVENRTNIKRYNGKTWDAVAPFLDAEARKTYWINDLTVDSSYRPWIALGGLTTSNIFALNPNGWDRYQGGGLKISTRYGRIWLRGNNRNFYKGTPPAYIPAGPADDWRYTLASEAASDDDYCLYSNKPTKSVTMINQPVVLKACADKPAPQEQFYMQNIDGNYIRIISSTTKLCVGLSTGSKINGGQVQLLPCSAKDQRQHWLMKTLNGTYTFQSRQSSKCLSVVGKVAKKDAMLEQTTCGAGNEQKFQIASLHKEKLPAGVNSNPADFARSPSAWVRVLQIKDARHCMSNNPKYKAAYSWSCGGNNIEQQMQIGGNRYQPGFTTIYSLTQKKCLSAYAAAVVSRSGIVTPKLEINSMPCNLRAPTQAWGLLPVGQGYFQLINRQFGLCAARPKGSKGPKNRIGLVKCDATADNQQFRNYNVVAK